MASEKPKDRKIEYESWQETAKMKCLKRQEKEETWTAKFLVLCEDEENEKKLSLDLENDGVKIKTLQCYGKKDTDVKELITTSLQEFSPTHLVLSKQGHGYKTKIRPQGASDRLIGGSRDVDDITNTILNMLGKYIDYDKDSLYVHERNYILFRNRCDKEVTHATWNECFDDKFADVKNAARVGILFACYGAEKMRLVIDEVVEELCVSNGIKNKKVVSCYEDGKYQLVIGEAIKQFLPTHFIVIEKEHGIKTMVESDDLFSTNNNQADTNNMYKLMNIALKRYIDYDLLYIHKDYIMFRTWNIYMYDNFLLVSAAVATDLDIENGMEEYLKSIKSDIIKNEISTKILILSGTHGSLDGKSAISSGDMGIKSAYHRMAEKVDKLKENGMEMDFEIVDLGEGGYTLKTLLDDVNMFKPTYIVLGWCYSAFGDVSMLLRSQAISASLAMLCDIRSITKRNDAELSEEQLTFLQKINERESSDDEKYKYTRIFIQGVSGSGKTLCAAELVKQRVAHILRTDSDAKVKIVIVLRKTNSQAYGQLKNDYEKKYLNHIDPAKVTLEFIDYNGLMNTDQHDHRPILLWDEVNMRHFPEEIGEVDDDGIMKYDASKFLTHIPDHSFYHTAVFCFTPKQELSSEEDFYTMKTEVQPPVLTVSLLRGFRNSKPIKLFMDLLQPESSLSTPSLGRGFSIVHTKGTEFDDGCCPSLFEKKDDFVHVYTYTDERDAVFDISDDIFSIIEDACKDIGKLLRDKNGKYDSGFVILAGIEFKTTYGMYYHFREWFGEDEYEKWKSGDMEHFRGCEADIVICVMPELWVQLLKVKNGMLSILEAISRAKKQLFLIAGDDLSFDIIDIMANEQCMRRHVFKDSQWIVE